jgi:hypothetical protein
MEEEFKNVDLWIEKYNSLSESEGYEFLVKTFNSDISQDFFEGVDISDTLLVIKEYLIKKDRMEDYISLIEIIKLKQPLIFKREFPYLTNEIISYYLLKNDLEKVLDYLQPFIEDPTLGIDEFIRIFKKMIYYGYDKLSLKIAKKCWKVIAESPEVIGGGEDDFMEVIYYHMWKQIYKDLKSFRCPDIDNLTTEFNSNGFELKNEDVKDIIDCISAYRGSLRIDFSRNESRIKSIKLLKGAFINHAVTKKNIDFTVAALIFDYVVYFWEGREITNKDKKLPETYFLISIEEFDDYLEDAFGGFIYEDDISEAAVLWGIPYVYEFLEAGGIISLPLLEKTIHQIDELKDGFIQRNSRILWECSFVHRWVRSDSISEEAFYKEADHFENSLHEVMEDDDSELDFDFELNKDEYADEDDDYFMDGFLKGSKNTTEVVNKKQDKAKKKAAKQQKRKNRKK